METFINKARKTEYSDISAFYDPAEVLVFDIETTGFAAETTMLYMIGCAYYEDGCFIIKQWFNDDGRSEEQMLDEFMDMVSRYKLLFSYNGDGFDIPYLMKKLKEYFIKADFADIESVDLYKELRHMKDILHLDNLKQKTVENFLGIKRLDKYSGGDLIKVYNTYLKTGGEQEKKLLIQHNYEDIEGFIACCSMLAYNRFRMGDFEVTKMQVRENHLVFSLRLNHSVPKRFNLTVSAIMITGYKDEATITAPIYKDELKFFFDNYKEYYYLPAEDMAVHKSVAGFVDGGYREKAKKETCYVRKEGYYISQVDDGIVSGYKKNYRDRESFVALVDSFLKDKGLITAYVRHVVKKAFDKKGN